MADLLNTGISALTAMQRALATTSNNIANVNTDGYSRQRVEFATRMPELTGSGYIGTGVDASAVRRIFDGFVQNRVNSSTSTYQREQAYLELATQVDDLLADSEAGLSTGLQSFFDSVQQLANDPTSTANRQVMLTESEVLVDRFHYLDQRLTDLNDTVNSQLRGYVGEINNLADSIAKLNVEIVREYARGSGQPPNDLLDQRDTLVTKLSEFVKVNTLEQDDGALNVFIGSGQTLVVGADTAHLSVQALGTDLERLDIAYQQANGSPVAVTDLISGGKLGGVLAFRDQVLDPSRNALGRIAVGMATAFNELHRQGMTLDGQVNTDFFVVPQPTVYPQGTNASTLAVDFADVGQLTTEDYELRYDGTNWALTRLSDGQGVTLSGTGTAADPFLADGLSLVVSGAPAAGDYYLIRPTQMAAQDIGVAVDNVRDIAAAGAVYAEASAANLGDATISPAQVLDPSDPNLLTSVSLVFDSPTTYQINGAGPSIAFTSGGDIDLNGWRVQIEGNPQTGDSFTLRSNAGGVGDNRNALALSELQNTFTLEAGAAGNPTATFAGAYEKLVAKVGTNTQAAQYNADAQESLLQQAQAQRESISGVNLDEEAANLLRFQQAYQAAAQMVSVADTLFQTLLSAVRR